MVLGGGGFISRKPQVDGSGLRTIDDADLARRLLEKVNSFNGDTGKQALALSLLFAATAFLPF